MHYMSKIIKTNLITIQQDYWFDTGVTYHIVTTNIINRVNVTLKPTGH